MCTICPAGKISKDRDAPECIDCKIGYYGKNLSSLKHKDRPVYDSCDSCPQGQYGEIEGGANIIHGCKLCVAGRHSNLKGANNISDPAEDGKMCKQCPLGRWSDVEGQKHESMCKSCNTGRYSITEASNNQDNCLACRPGFYSPIIGGSEDACHPCDAGKYQPKDGQAFCLPCGVGERQHMDGQINCSKCLQGRFSNVPHNDAEYCQFCEAGMFTDGPGQSMCQLCPAGRSGSIGSMCTKCQPGLYRGNADKIAPDKCKKCNPGHFAKEPEQPFCLECMPGYYNPSYGKTTCLSCNKGQCKSTACFVVPCLNLISLSFLLYLYRL